MYDGEAAITLRAIADGARETRTRAAGGEVAYLALMSRLLQDNRGPRPGDAIETRNAESSIILP